MKELESLDAAFVIDTFLLLLIGIGPKIALVPFLDMTAGMTESTKRRVRRKMLTTAALVAALLLILGGLLTRLLHFSPGALGVASGIILLIIAATMVLGQGNGTGGGSGALVGGAHVGGAQVGGAYAGGGQVGGGPGGGHQIIGRDPMQVAVLPLAVPVTEKVFGFLLAALGVQLVLNGLADVGVIRLTGH